MTEVLLALRRLGHSKAGLRTRHLLEPSIYGHVCTKSKELHPRRASERQPFREEAARGGGGVGARGSHPSAAPLWPQFRAFDSQGH